MANLKTFWAIHSTLPVALLTGWRVARLLASIERLIAYFISISSFVAFSDHWACSAGNRPLLCLRGQLRQGKYRPPRAPRNGWGCQRCDQGHRRSVRCGGEGRSQQANRSTGLDVCGQMCEAQTSHSPCARRAGGRGVVVGPVLNQWRSDVFCDNENGKNFLFKNNGDGTFEDVAQRAGQHPPGHKRPRCRSHDVILLKWL